MSTVLFGPDLYQSMLASYLGGTSPVLGSTKPSTLYVSLHGNVVEDGPSGHLWVPSWLGTEVSAADYSRAPLPAGAVEIDGFFVQVLSEILFTDEAGPASSWGNVSSFAVWTDANSTSMSSLYFAMNLDSGADLPAGRQVKFPQYGLALRGAPENLLNYTD